MGTVAARDHVRSTPVSVLRYAPQSGAPSLIPPGTALVVFTRQGDSLIEELVASIRLGSEGRFCEHFVEEFERRMRRRPTLAEALAMEAEAPVLADLEHGSGSDGALLRGLFLPPAISFGHAYLHYTGDAFDASAPSIRAAVPDSLR